MALVGQVATVAQLVGVNAFSLFILGLFVFVPITVCFPWLCLIFVCIYQQTGGSISFSLSAIQNL
jgi:cytochrome bd-type quinol oxidase subunit 1